MTRPILYYALVSGYNLEIMAVTSENKSQIYGSVDSVGSHRRKDVVKAKFNSYEAAEKARAGVKEIIKSYEPKYKALSKQMNDLHYEELKEIQTYLENK